MSNEGNDKETIIRTISISAEDDKFLKDHKGEINFSNECRNLIKTLKAKIEGGSEE